VKQGETFYNAAFGTETNPAAGETAALGENYRYSLNENNSGDEEEEDEEDDLLVQEDPGANP